VKSARAPGPDWFGQVRDQGVPAVAGRFGLELVTVGADTSFTCPACGKAQRHSKSTDKRRAAKVTPDRGGWWCEPCQATGDAVSVAAFVVTGSLKPPAERWGEVRSACAAHGLCEADPSDPRGPAPVRYVPPARPVVTVAAPVRLPAAEVAALWAECSRLDAVPGWDLEAGGGDWCGEVRAYLSGRRLEVGALVAADVARVLPPPARVASWPAWWPSSWCGSWRLAVPLYDARGEHVAMQARAIDGSDEPKTRNPRGAGVTAGTFFGNPEGLELLRGTYSGPGLTMVEGLTDFLAAVVLCSHLEASRRPAVLGVIAGSARALAGVRVSVSRVNVITDNDATGEKYASEVTNALDRRTTRVLLTPIGERRADLNDLLKARPAAALAALTYGMGAAHGE
jgi:hypothetical protein